MELTKKILDNEKYRACLSSIEEAEKRRVFCRHGMEHCLDVARIACIMELERGYGLSKDLIYSAALLHDIGRGEEYSKGLPHEEAGVRIAETVLEECGAAPEDILTITRVIQNHRGQNLGEVSVPSGKREVLAMLIKEADVLSRPCFSCKARPECKWPDDKKNKSISY